VKTERSQVIDLCKVLFAHIAGAAALSCILSLDASLVIPLRQILRGHVDSCDQEEVLVVFEFCVPPKFHFRKLREKPLVKHSEGHI